MTIPSFPVPRTGSDLDVGPLTWILPEVREALNRSDSALRHALTADADTRETSLRHARNHLHQAHGALQMVDIDGVPAMTAAMESLLDRIGTDGGGSAPVSLTHALADAMAEAGHAVLDYLDELMGGAAPQPLRLYPYYRTLMEAGGAERVDTAPFFLPHLHIVPAPMAAAGTAPAASQEPLAGLRQRYEKALLLFMKSAEPSAQMTQAMEIREVLAAVAESRSTADGRGFWRVLQGFADALASGQISHPVQAKQILAQINLQLRRADDEKAHGSEAAVRLAREVLLQIATLSAPAGLAAELGTAYGIHGQVPTDYERKRYSQIDPAVLSAAKERLAQAKMLWNRVADGESGSIPPFVQELAGMEAAIAAMHLPAFKTLLARIAQEAPQAVPVTQGNPIGMEIATALLFLENALQHIKRLPDDINARANALCSRLQKAVSGVVQPEPDAWLNDMTRQAQQRQTMSALAGEMHASLRQVEKSLDAYFGKPEEKGPLASIDQMLHQIGGALSMLDQEHAARALSHTRSTIAGFVQDATPEKDNPDFRLVAQNIGALSFFVETLQRDPEQARNRFAFDQDSGTFKALLFEHGQGKGASGEAFIQPESLPMPAVGDAAIQFSATSDALHDVESAAAVKSHAGELVLPAVPSNDVGDSDPAVPAMQAPQEPEMERSPALASDPAASPESPASEEELDAELLEIFLSEAEEVLECIQQTLPEARLTGAQDAITILRRSFHTLKGSSRMVGLDAFGEAAWSVERLLNAWLAGEKFETQDVLSLLDRAAGELGEWVAEIRTEGRSARSPDALRDAADRIRNGGEVSVDDGKQAAAEIQVSAVSENHEPAAFAGEVLAEIDLHDIDAATADSAGENQEAPLPETLLPEITPAEADAESMSLAEESASLTVPMTALDDAAPTAEPAPADGASPAEQEFGCSLDPAGYFPADLPEFTAEHFAGLEVASVPADPVAEADHEAESLSLEIPGDVITMIAPPESDEADSAVMAEPNSAGPSLLADQPDPEETAESVDVTASALGTEPGSSLADETEEQSSSAFPAQTGTVLNFPIAPQADRIDENVKRIGSLEISVPLHAIYLAETDELIRLLRNEFSEWRHEPERVVATQAVHAAHSLAGSSATVGLQPLQEVAHAMEMLLQRLARQHMALLPSDYDLLDAAVLLCQEMLGRFALSEMPEYAPEMVASLEAMLARIMLPAADDPASRDAASVETTALQGTERAQEDKPEGSASELADSFGFTAETIDIGLAGLPDGKSQVPFAGAVSIADELDHDLLPVFIEEARDLLPRVGETLREWRGHLQDGTLPQKLLRDLHTIKGSARMAGAMRLGQHIHDLESRVEQLARSGTPSRQFIDDLLGQHDYGLFLFESLLGQDVAAPVTGPASGSLPAVLPENVAQADETFGRSDETATIMGSPQQPVPALQQLPQPAGVQSPAAQPLAAASAAGNAPLVRVRADLLDRLVNQAGEVSLSRSRLETEVGALQESLGELTENVQRLRSQLREIEIQAETQISSSMSQAGDRGFDPLEFDRFTRLQELTRMMAESVNDVASVQQNIARTIDGASTSLIAQGRLTRDLQQDLMRVRMVQFGSIAERLYRITRQTAKELDKRVNLDIRGTSVEMDRGVLEKMTGPFEHLLRNAIVHGIESRDVRRASDKNETGELLIEIRQEGNEVVIRFSDDGRGLDSPRIREKATALGLIENGSALSENEANELIFLPGFSTASDVTELAGRGVGMDVVRSETAALGGRVSVWSEAGRGTQFTIHLPLTLAVTQVVLLSTGGRMHAVPSVLVEQVIQLKANSLASVYNDGAVIWQGERVPLYYLSTLLGDAAATPVAQQYSPILVLQSGGSRVAVHVDEVVGNREVVVKNVGPQLARMIGIAGATVLGSGDIVLILNPVPIAQSQKAAQARRLPSTEPTGSVTSDEVGAVAEMAPSTSVPAPVPGLRTQRTVMIVDDSLTVRRVTQRLLSREGYQIVLAKDGVDALEQLQTVTPDIMLVDIEMPRMDGFDLTRNVRSDERTREVPIIMITSRTAGKHRNLAMELGVNEYLGKPYVEADLLEKIAGYLSRTVDTV